MSLRSWGFKSPLAHHHYFLMPLRMTDLDWDDTYGDLGTGRRRPRRKKVLPRPLLSLLLVLTAIIVVAVIIVFVAKGAIRTGEAAAYERYMTSVADILQRSDTVGESLTELLTSPGDTNRIEIQARLDAFVAESEKLQVEAEALEVPKDFIKQGVHQFFLLVMSFRQTGVAELKLALMNALEVEDTEVPSEQIAHALRYLTNSDFIYKEVFISRAADLLAEKNLLGSTFPARRSWLIPTSLQAPKSSTSWPGSRPPAAFRPSMESPSIKWWQCPTTRRSLQGARST